MSLDGDQLHIFAYEVNLDVFGKTCLQRRSEIGKNDKTLLLVVARKLCKLALTDVTMNGMSIGVKFGFELWETLQGKP